MGANATQGLAVVAFLVAFTCLAAALFAEGNLLLMAMFIGALAISIVLFQKCKPLEHQEK